ncbi:MAG: hypothetical protein AAGU11_13935 [Syntrophobacteraceae bacterium]
MELKTVLSALLLVMAMTVLSTEAPQDTQRRSEWVNSPQVEYTPDGDRASKYPPYHRPDK